jgi:hypothetical protein
LEVGEVVGVVAGTLEAEEAVVSGPPSMTTIHRGPFFGQQQPGGWRLGGVLVVVAK